ncbi:hypothetical protein E2C01_049888 [Portunus trituberculatus]|uniref:Uncharacterized protein n=1 Tax=Portunus trituberculatus TaxID=210409 RepID=A0A5B7G6T0_PORTR|nr:hypothetical protein [Portunus trituberculatus]
MVVSNAINFLASRVCEQVNNIQLHFENGVYRLLYEEVDESEVPIVQFIPPDDSSGLLDEFSCELPVFCAKLSNSKSDFVVMVPAEIMSALTSMRRESAFLASVFKAAMMCGLHSTGAGAGQLLGCLVTVSSVMAL